MDLTASQKRIQGRRAFIRNAYNNKGETLVSALVKTLSEKLGVSEVTIYSDLKEEGLLKNESA